MEVVLKKDHDKLGKAMDVVNVKDGYARNFLIPQGIAVVATEGNRKAVAESKRIAEKREEKKQKEAREQAKQIEKIPCTIKAKVGEDDRLFGSVTTQEIADFLAKEGFAVDKKDLELEEPIKQLGVYSVKITLYKDVIANLKVWVVKEESK
ncbi:MAG TPA: 50S ribosomal protein L9 [Chitinivibrionales bacterium]|nr:50S ribosomal protein L9 [Chitinivibrionales bacterium]